MNVDLFYAVPGVWPIEPGEFIATVAVDVPDWEHVSAAFRALPQYMGGTVITWRPHDA